VSFHLSLPVRSIEESIDFYTRVLQATVTHRDPGGYVNLDFYGTQLTLHPGEPVKLPRDFHFGVNLDAEGFERLAGALDTEVQVADAGTVMERKKVYVRDPNGYVVEIKSAASRRGVGR
jgi:uncharacterized protein